MKHVKALPILYILFTCLCGSSLVAAKEDSVKVEENLVIEEESARRVEQKIRTIYGTDGHPYSQSERNKGLHQVWGTGKMSNGIDTIEINTSPRDGRQDVSFEGEAAYFGTVRAFIVNGNTYTVIPIDGEKFVIQSSDTTDTASVRFKLEGH